MILWDVGPYSFVDRCQYLGRTCCFPYPEDVGSNFLGSIGKYLLISYSFRTVACGIGNDRERSSYIIDVAKRYLCKQRSLLSNDRNRHACNNIRYVGNGVLCAVRAEDI
jgi:hypothetical protein